MFTTSKTKEDADMTRTELTIDIMKDRGFSQVDDIPLETVVKKIKTGIYKYLRMAEDKEYVYSSKEYTMCSTYDVFWNIEYLEASYDNVNWFKVAQRKINVRKRCVYAD